MKRAGKVPQLYANLNQNDEGPTVAAVAPQESERNESPKLQAAPLAEQALRVIEGERRAAQYLHRLKAGQADPEELAVIASVLYSATLRGFCRVIEKALRVKHV